MKPPVLVTKRIYPEAIEYLKQHAEVDYAASDDGLSPEELLDRIRGKQAVVSQLTDKFSAAVIDQLDGVRIIANVAVGFDNIDIPSATRRKILVTNTPDVLTDTTADFAFTLLMAAARRVVEGHHFVHSGQWTKWRIDLLVGQDIITARWAFSGWGGLAGGGAARARIDKLLGFVAAMRVQCAEFQRFRGITVTFHAIASDQDASPQASLCLYRALQECLMNISKHSGSLTAEVSLAKNRPLPRIMHS